MLRLEHFLNGGIETTVAFEELQSVSVLDPAPHRREVWLQAGLAELLFDMAEPERVRRDRSTAQAIRSDPVGCTCRYAGRIAFFRTCRRHPPALAGVATQPGSTRRRQF